MDLGIYSTDAFKFGIVMLSWGLVIGAITAWGITRRRYEQMIKSRIDEITVEPLK